MGTKKLNPRTKKVWVEALRSGDYKQGAGSLCRETKSRALEFCCLGVAEDLRMREQFKNGARWVPAGNLAVGATGDKVPFRNVNAEFLNKQTIKWLGIPDGRANISVPVGEARQIIGNRATDKFKVRTEGIDGTTISLATMNDYGIPFSAIADIIEELL